MKPTAFPTPSGTICTAKKQSTLFSSEWRTIAKGLSSLLPGYPKPMEKFLRTNSGLESRFTRFIRFEDYEVADLCRIFDKFCKDAEYSLTPACRPMRAYYSSLPTVSGMNASEMPGISATSSSKRSAGIPSDWPPCPVQMIDKHSLITLDAPDIPFDAIADFNIRAIDIQEAKWDGECPSLQKTCKGGVEFSGQRVSRKCGQKFIFPWWSIDPATVRGSQTEFLTLERSVDKRGQVENAQRKPHPVHSRGTARPAS